jgi:hypothetical protein
VAQAAIDPRRRRHRFGAAVGAEGRVSMPGGIAGDGLFYPGNIDFHFIRI